MRLIRSTDAINKRMAEGANLFYYYSHAYGKDAFVRLEHGDEIFAMRMDDYDRWMSAEHLGYFLCVEFLPCCRKYRFRKLSDFV